MNIIDSQFPPRPALSVPQGKVQESVCLTMELSQSILRLMQFGGNSDRAQHLLQKRGPERQKMRTGTRLEGWEGKIAVNEIADLMIISPDHPCQSPV